MSPRRPCAVEGCTRPAARRGQRGMCHRHYERLRGPITHQPWWDASAREIAAWVAAEQSRTGGVAPSIREHCARWGRSSSVMVNYLRRGVELGLLEHHPHTTRCYRAPRQLILQANACCPMCGAAVAS